MKKSIKACAITATCCLALGVVTACGGKSSGKPVEDAEYTFSNDATVIPDYEKEIFTIDGVIDEAIYDNLRWWGGVYQEGEFQSPCEVKMTSYMGEKGIYFAFDVNDDNVNVIETSPSFVNSCIEFYLASSKATSLSQNVWEIDVVPNNFINAKRYLGNESYTTMNANGAENTPYVQTTPKGGPINTKECTGYVMEAYFTYDFLFADGNVPEELSINVALIRAYDLDPATQRDVYYNFGQNSSGSWSWGNPTTWYRFNKFGWDAALVEYNEVAGGKIEMVTNAIARYESGEFAIVPDEGYKIKKLTKTEGETETDIIDDLRYENGKYYYKLFNVNQDVKIDAEFEKLPSEQYSLSGTVSYAGSPLGNDGVSDLYAVYYDGGKGYTSDLTAEGEYAFNVTDGDGVVEIWSKRGYKVCSENVSVSGEAKVFDVALTDKDYGKARRMNLSDVQVMGNSETVYDGAKWWNTVNSNFIYDFSVKATGEIFDENGKLLEDPTFGQFENAFTGVSLRGMFTDGDGKELTDENFLLQIFHWGATWYLKIYVDGTPLDISFNEHIVDLYGGGLDLRLQADEDGISVYYLKNDTAIRLIKNNYTYKEPRYLRLLRFYGEQNVNQTVWELKGQRIDFGAASADSKDLLELSQMNETTFFTNSSSNVTFEKAYGARNNRYIARYRIKSDAVTADGIVNKSAQIYFNTWTNTDASNDWKTNYGIMFCLDAENSRIYGWSYSDWTNRTVMFTEEQLKLIGTVGLDMVIVADGTEFSVYLTTSKGALEKVMSAPVAGKYFVAHKGDVYKDSANLTISGSFYSYNDGSLTDLFTALFGSEYTSVKTEMSVSSVLGEQAKKTYKNTANEEFESTYGIRPNNAYAARYNVQSSALVKTHGTESNKNIFYFNTWTNTTGNAWSSSDTNYGVMLRTNGSGLELYGWSVSHTWTNRTVKFTQAQLDLLASENGIDIVFTHDGTTFAVWLETAEGVLEKVMWANAAGRYIVAHKTTVYGCNAERTIEVKAYTYTGEKTIVQAIGELFKGCYVTIKEQ